MADRICPDLPRRIFKKFPKEFHAGREKTSRALPSSSCQGDASPWIPVFLGLWGQDFSLCLADTPRKDDRPPTHFFVKKKFSPTCGAGAATQKVPGVSCCAHTLCNIQHCGAHGIPQAGLPPC